MKKGQTRRIFRVGFLLAGLGFALPSVAATYYWTDWQQSNPSGGTAFGEITPSSGPVVDVRFEALNADASPGSYRGVAGDWLWNPPSTYSSTEVENAPGYEGLQLIGNINMTYRVHLSEPIKDPVMAIASLGSGSDSAVYQFDSPFAILSQGITCCWGGGDDRLTQLPGNVLQGFEGAGVIKFLGTYSSFAWTVPDPENWHGFTFGIRTTERLEPTPTPTVRAPGVLALLAIGLLGTLLARHRFG